MYVMGLTRLAKTYCFMSAFQPKADSLNTLAARQLSAIGGHIETIG